MEGHQWSKQLARHLASLNILTLGLMIGFVLKIMLDLEKIVLNDGLVWHITSEI
jgi:hypothetical protein